MSSTFFPSEVVKVGLTSTFSVLTGDDTRTLRNADIRLFSGTQLLEKLDFVEGDAESKGYYATLDYRPIVGVNYTLHVVVPGFDPLTAVSSIPPPVPLRLLKLIDVKKREVEEYDEITLSLQVDYDDPVDEINFYNLRLVQERLHYMIAFNGDTVFTHETYAPLHIANALDGTYSKALGTGGILVSDRPNNRALSLVTDTQLRRGSEKLGQIFAELRTVSPEYYNYQKSLSQTGGATIGGGIQPPSVVQSNVENGAGFFAGYASSSDSVRIYR